LRQSIKIVPQAAAFKPVECAQNRMPMQSTSTSLHFWIYSMAVIAIAIALHWLRHMPRFFSLLSLPGTAGHEALHFLVGTLTLARPIKASLLPTFHRNGSTTLGYVMFANIRWYNALFVGLAPLLALPFAVALVHYRAAAGPPWGWMEIAWGYLAANLAYSCTPSRADLEIVFSKPLGSILWLAAAATAVWLWLQP
jgi:hypothetical protein